MQNELLSMFKAITPDNIKNLPIISDSMEIFIELLEQYSPISLNIKTSLSEDTTPKIEEELPKVYLYDYYSMIENLRNNKTIVNKFKKWNEALNPNIYPIGLPIISDRLFIDYFIIGQEGGVLHDNDEPDDEIKWNINPLSGKLDVLKQNILQNKAENYYINRKFKESKGLKKSIQFIYDIVNEHIVNPDERRALEINETGRPFEFSIISGSMDKDIYKQSVAYLAHPLGFTYEYIYISELRFSDDYGLRKIYNVRMLEVRCLSGNVEKYIKNVIYIEEKTNYLKIVFSDGSYLLQENDRVRYFDKDDFLIKMYSADKHCSIFIDYNIEYSTSLTDYTKFDLTRNFEPDIIPEVLDDMKFRETLEFKKNFIIGLSVIGEDYISNDNDVFSTILLEEFFESSEYTSFIDNTGEILDDSSFSALLRFKRNFVIGASIVGDVGVEQDLISNDTDAVEPNLITDVLVVNKNNTGDEIYNITDLNEDFSIEVY